MERSTCKKYFVFIQLINNAHQYGTTPKEQKNPNKRQVCYLGNGQGRAPLLFEDVKADTAIAINVWMVDFCPEGNLFNARIVSML